MILIDDLANLISTAKSFQCLAAWTAKAGSPSFAIWAAEQRGLQAHMGLVEL